MKKNIIGISIGVICLLNFAISGLAIAHGWKAPKKESSMRNPLPPTELNIESGRALYDHHCGDCHGQNGEGGIHLDLGMDSVPPDLLKRLKGHSDGDFFWKIKTGRGEMPSFEEELEKKEIWQIITFLRSLF